MKKKKLILILAAVVLVLAIAGGGIAAAMKRNAKPVQVASVANMNNGYWNDNSDISPYGNVTTNLNQEIRYDESLIITEVYVNEGDTVKVGDPLIAYDTTLVSMELEMKQMQIDGLGLSIQNVQAELDQLRKTKPVASAAPSALTGMRLASSMESSSEESSSDAPTEPSSEPAVLEGQVYTEIGAASVPYKGSGTAEDPYRFYVFPAEGKESVTIAKDYLQKALTEQTCAVFDTVDDGAAPTKIVSSWAMDWSAIAGLISQESGTPLTETQKQAPVYESITAECVPYNPDADGSAENPYRFLCTPGASADISFLTNVMAEQSVCVFEVVKDNMVLYTWSLDGREEVSDEPEPPVDPGFPGIDIPSGPTKEELASQIKEKEDALKDLDLQKRTAELELKQLKRKMDDGVIESTVNGTVKSVLDEETAKLEGSPLITVVGEEGFYITGFVAETALDKIEKGMAVTATSWNDGMAYDASITSVSNTPSSGNYFSSNPNMSYYPFTAVIKGDADLRNGDGVDLSVEGMENGGSSMESGAIYLAQAFVREEGNRYYVYKKGDDGRLTKQYVEAGKIIYGSLEILSGLTLEDEIAFPYGKAVKEGAKTETVDSLYNYGY